MKRLHRTGRPKGRALYGATVFESSNVRKTEQREQRELERKELARLVERLFDNVRFVRSRLGELRSDRDLDANALELLRTANATLADVYRSLF